MHNYEQAQIPFNGSNENKMVMNASCTAENRTDHVIVAHFHSEIKKPLSVALTLKPPHMIHFVLVVTI